MILQLYTSGVVYGKSIICSKNVLLAFQFQVTDMYLWNLNFSKLENYAKDAYSPCSAFSSRNLGIGRSWKQNPLLKVLMSQGSTSDPQFVWIPMLRVATCLTIWGSWCAFWCPPF